MAHSTAKSSPAPVAVTKASATAGKTSGRRRARTPAQRPSATPLAKERTEFLAGIVGGAELARMLGVSRSQPTRWRSGAEQPGPDAARGLVDLDHVMTRALMLWPARVATDWLTSANAYLDGARPLDVLKVRGSAEVIDALDAVAAGAYA
ncbi:hypothetical protein TUM20983_37530 [Mycobacterium antarcticum]|uniref:antitoxin Xre/MbcA/ParS toxin-binding domain-containing protein n=1 Tax=Mycolicibacterium sp. TUM20983 TaxID=3023369 RepID=UPI00239E89C5|nr:antitoxin Xre/MbcA/ParS toxin-binding domain-containing protein [Mycolicibacterium sp. TUM20983]GLP76643.1 hypothetical protein TUM20983_37530 [Mycolicibacterium sp. TUM20983]